MTAFGRGAIDFEGIHFTVEIQSVNRKHLEIQVVLPRMLSLLETEVRSTVAATLFRGQISLRIQAVFHKESPYRFQPNLPLAIELKKAWDAIGTALGEKGFTLEILKESPDILVAELDESELSRLKRGLVCALETSLKELIGMKEKEGQALYSDFTRRLETLHKGIAFIEKQSIGACDKWRKKLVARIQEVVSLPENDERLLKEIALMAERLDITEECVRFQSHIVQFRDTLEQSGAVGKTLEFILQELGREINTIGSKSQDVEISKRVIEIKAELERMREQVQNVE